MGLGVVGLVILSKLLNLNKLNNLLKLSNLMSKIKYTPYYFGY